VVSLSSLRINAMPKHDHWREPPRVRPPILARDFPDIPQNPSSELQPPPNPSATPGKVAGTMSGLPQPETQEAMRKTSCDSRTRASERRSTRFWTAPGAQGRNG
jgi:hypothetical protein